MEKNMKHEMETGIIVGCLVFFCVMERKTETLTFLSLRFNSKHRNFSEIFQFSIGTW